MGTEGRTQFEQQHGDCTAALEQYIFYGVMLGMIFGSLIFIHFILVIYTYWQEAAEEEEKTGGDQEDEEPLMQNDME